MQNRLCRFVNCVESLNVERTVNICQFMKKQMKNVCRNCIIKIFYCNFSIRKAENIDKTNKNQCTKKVVNDIIIKDYV